VRGDKLSEQVVVVIAPRDDVDFRAVGTMARWAASGVKIAP
jgi:LmbE family N-acetylglucosaminyl deacetylase